MWFSLALQVAFGSLYRDEVLINPSRVIALLAAGSMLQLVSGNGSIFSKSLLGKVQGFQPHLRLYSRDEHRVMATRLPLSSGRFSKHVLSSPDRAGKGVFSLALAPPPLSRWEHINEGWMLQASTLTQGLLMWPLGFKIKNQGISPSLFSCYK